MIPVSPDPKLVYSPAGDDHRLYLTAGGLHEGGPKCPGCGEPHELGWFEVSRPWAVAFDRTCASHFGERYLEQLFPLWRVVTPGNERSHPVVSASLQATLEKVQNSAARTEAQLPGLDPDSDSGEALTEMVRMLRSFERFLQHLGTVAATRIDLRVECDGSCPDLPAFDLFLPYDDLLRPPLGCASHRAGSAPGRKVAAQVKSGDVRVPAAPIA